MKIASRTEAGLLVANKVASVVAAAVLAAMMLLTVVDVVGRYCLDRPVPGAWEIVRLLLIYASTWGLGYCQSQKGHIRVTILIERFSSCRALAILDSISYFIGLAVLSLLCWQVLVLAGTYFSLKGGVTETLGIPFYPFMLALAIGIAMLVLTLIADFVHSLAEATRK
jgi:TRAP-type C4-dicarboxylate transport system permease small subunit